LDTLNNFFIPPSQINNLTLEQRYKILWHTGAIYNVFSLWVQRGMEDPPEKMGELFARILPNSLDQEFIRQPFLFNV
jgi:hypothetical protein